MAQKELKTSITIAASSLTIWEILTDFKAYASWNPFLTSLEGDFKVGQRVKIKAGGMKFTPLVLAFIPTKEIRWLGKLLFHGLFDGDHTFQIQDNANGTCTFHQNEKFSGILVGLFAQKLDTDTKFGFEAMNAKLKELAEKKEQV